MKIRYAIAHTFIQAGLAEAFLMMWEIWNWQGIPETFYSSAMLVFFIGLFSGIITVVLWTRVAPLARMTLSTIGGSALTSLMMLIYPQFGFTMEWYLLLGILLLAAFIGHMVLWGFQKTEVTDYDGETF